MQYVSSVQHRNKETEIVSVSDTDTDNAFLSISSYTKATPPRYKAFTVHIVKAMELLTTSDAAVAKKRRSHMQGRARAAKAPLKWILLPNTFILIITLKTHNHNHLIHISFCHKKGSCI